MWWTPSVLIFLIFLGHLTLLIIFFLKLLPLASGCRHTLFYFLSLRTFFHIHFHVYTSSFSPRLFSSTPPRPILHFLTYHSLYSPRVKSFTLAALFCNDHSKMCSSSLDLSPELQVSIYIYIQIYVCVYIYIMNHHLDMPYVLAQSL